MAWWEWVFSGIGANAITRLFDKAQPPTNEITGNSNTQVVNNSGSIQITNVQHPPTPVEANKSHEGPIYPIEYLTHPTPDEIYAEVRRAVPLQQARVAESYISLHVDWLLQLADHQYPSAVLPINGKQMTGVVCYYADPEDPPEGTPHGNTTLFVDLARYPRFNTLASGAQFRVRGEIKSCSAGIPMIVAHTVQFV